ncbi:MAG: hypothetical protein H0X31_07455 [Nostocaceae cyanobacterium]|nr:hypothetical protein [Nostocaceae cyanobacterium]
MDYRFDFKLISSGANIIAVIAAGLKLSDANDVDTPKITDKIKCYLENIKMYCRIVTAVFLLFIGTVADKLTGTDN